MFDKKYIRSMKTAVGMLIRKYFVNFLPKQLAIGCTKPTKCRKNNDSV
jgi:hypothetical protein